MLYSSDEELTRRYRELCTAVGHLFISFGRWEGVLAATLRLHLANNVSGRDAHESVVLSSAIYGSMRFKAARDTMRRLAKAEGVAPEVDAFLDGLFGHIGHIENLRDKLAHQAIVQVHADHATKDGDWQVSDQTVTRDLKAIKVYVFNVQAVVNAACDLITAGDRLGNVVVGSTLFEGLNLEPVPWLYKPASLKHVRLGTARVRSK